ncbi:inactive transglutaminase family protein [Nitrincola tapanii]|uniref:Gonadoliberin III n=1 Tax=Nitrincola tapanii TaxID=1708751 RepID=A0A5A9W4N0_9GAMM|nr:inactive transglutaminase family protein [Nitrincola tapanii]KAA0875677.1 gonadoliberin III [Nitrincola tapanii]
MISRAPFYTIIALLILVGLGSALTRHLQLGIPWLPGEQKQVWLIEARVDFNASGTAVLASLDLPDNPPGFTLLNEQAASPGYGFSIIENDGQRRGEWSKNTATGAQTLYYKAQFITDPDKPISRVERRPRVKEVFWDEPEATAATYVLELAQSKSSTPESLTRELIRLIQNPEPGQNTALLLSASSRVAALEKLLNQAGIPARIAIGLYLEDARRRQATTPMIEIFVDDRWLVFNPETGEQGLPENLLLWQRGGDSLLDVMGGSRSRVSFSMIEQTLPSLELAQTQFAGQGFAWLGVHTLPIEEQSMFKLLFLLPLGAMVVVFMRIIIGLKTSGTFMPILIALAFLQTSLGLGLISFVSIVAMGLVIRTYLSRLNLLLVSRIATLVILVVFLVSFLSLVGYQLGFSTGMTITFFPMIIIAWTIERMSILWEEEGPREVLTQGGGSLLVAVLAYLLMQLPISGHLTFNFPELNLVILALIMLMGQYTGYKFSELRRFRALLENQK